MIADLLKDINQAISSDAAVILATCMGWNILVLAP